MVWEEGSHEWDPPLTTPQKRGDTPPSPLFEGGSREPGTEVRGGYIESRGKPGAFSLPRVSSDSTWLLMFGCCS